MLVVRSGSSHEKRLIHESRVLNRRLRRMARAIGGEGVIRDCDAEKLNHELGCDVVGLVAVKIRLGMRAATLICAPGAYFDDRKPERREQLEKLARGRRAQGRRTVIVSKHQVLGRVPLDLVRTIEGPAGQDRRRLAASASVTGGRTLGGPDPRRAAALRSPGLDARAEDELVVCGVVADVA